MKCKKGLEIKVLKSCAGYYLGTEIDGMPNCRISGYAEGICETSTLMPDRQTGCIENEFCNGGNGCFAE